MLDYKQVVENLDSQLIIKLMEKLGADRWEEKDSFIIFPTICHNINSSEASMKLYFYKDNKIFYCYTEDGKMSIFTFLENYYKTRQIEYDWYEDVFLAAKNCSTEKDFDILITPKRQDLKERYRKREPIQIKTIPSTILDVFIKYYPVEWLNDGISKESMDKFNILFSISQNKIIIPHYNIDNELIGVRGRALNDWEIENIGKYMPVKIEQQIYSHKLSQNLYGLNVTKKAIRETGYVFIFEAEKSVLQCESFNRPNCAVAICGSSLNKYQMNILLKECHPREIVLCLDNEENDNEEKYFYKLLEITRKYNSYVNISFIYDREKITDKKDSPSDKGEDIFEKLLSRRVIVFEK